MITPKEYIDDELRELIHLRDKKCQLCNKEGKWIKIDGRFFVAQWEDVGTYDYKWRWNRFHCDHIIPEIMGGKTIDKNLRLTCPKCNLTRKKYEMV